MEQAERAWYEFISLVVFIVELAAGVAAYMTNVTMACAAAGIAVGAYLSLMWPFWRKVHEGKITTFKLKYIAENLAAFGASLIVIGQLIIYVPLIDPVSAFFFGFTLAFTAKNVVHEAWKTVWASVQQSA